MKFKNVNVYGVDESIYRSGYPHQIGEPEDLEDIVENEDFDMYESKSINRAKKLAKTSIGSGHSNFLKGIIVQFDILYPQYFSQQLQRYNFIDVISSQSKMVSITKIKDIAQYCNKYVLPSFIEEINKMIDFYNLDRDDDSPVYYPEALTRRAFKVTTKQELFQYIISNLPMGFELWMGVSTNYLQLKTIYNQRKHHKLIEWKEFCNWIKTLPMSELITGEDEKG
jgi:hypothetical protein